MKIICVGRNYADHIAELANEKPQEPVLFLKPDTAILQKGQPFFIPAFTENIHYEVEVLVKIKRIGKHIQPQFAHKYYDEVALGIDFTARDLQSELKAKGLPWEKAKGFDGSALVGEWISKKDLPPHNTISFALHKNGTQVQAATTAQMLWDIEQLVAYCSTFFTLKIGDILFTGTPKGVGAVARDDVFVGLLEGKENFRVKIK
ncbi:MAG: fumarylacetoacetate hydrolase family protein [Flavobacteriaceae bacterium]